MNYIIFLATMSVLFVACIKEECKINGGQYEFEIPATLSPAKDTFQVGDTIHLFSTFTDEVYERKTDRFYKLINFRFYPELRIREISNSIADEGALSSFNVLVDSSFNFSKFNYSSGSIGYIGQYNYENGTYTLSYMLIPNEAGFFHFAHGCSLASLGEDQDFEGKCKNLTSDVDVKLNDGVNNNIHMLSDSPDPHYNDWILQKPEERFHKFGGYVFYVKD